jgi:peroxiredoxin
MNATQIRPVAPVDDGAADHLFGARLPDLRLPATTGDSVRLSDLDGAIVFVYPRTGAPGHPPGPDWNAIPGARGCTAEGCAYRDLHGEFNALGVRVFGLSTQSTEYQQEFADRIDSPFPILSDASLKLVRSLDLPTFEFEVGDVGGGGPNTLIQRMTWFIWQGVIRKVWYPVFPPHSNAELVLAWLRSRD